jgi:uncharacterized protein (DUF1684 family)
MGKKRFIFIFLGLAFVVAFIYSFQGTHSEYAKEIKKQRLERQVNLSRGKKAVVTKEEKANFQYFEPKASYRIVADVKKIDSLITVSLNYTNAGVPTTFIYFAKLEFKLEGEKRTLYLLQDPLDESFILPFADQTNGEETYGAGRLLPIRYNGSKTLTLDFNMAQNPMCAYSDSYQCPMPPEKNQLDVKIEAGEKKFDKR